MDDDTIEREILSSRLALSMAERAATEFGDLRGRIATLERRDELDASDLLRPHVLARLVLDSWRQATLTLEQVGGKWTISAIHLDLTAKVPGIDKAAFEKAAEEAKANCPVSQVLKAAITLTSKLET